MDRTLFLEIEKYMHECMGDSAHSSQHIYRVLYLALEIVEQEKDVDYDVLIASCLLHDIGREAQFCDPTVCHAVAGAKMAKKFLSGKWDEAKIDHVCECIRTHRFRSNEAPQSIEAKVLFDADTLDVTGAIGIARTFLYQGKVNTPIYMTDEEGKAVVDQNPHKSQSFIDEYNYKLKKAGTRLYTKRAKQICKKRNEISEMYYNSLIDEIKGTTKGKSVLSGHIDIE